MSFEYINPCSPNVCDQKKKKHHVSLTHRRSHRSQSGYFSPYSSPSTKEWQHKGLQMRNACNMHGRNWQLIMVTRERWTVIRRRFDARGRRHAGMAVNGAQVLALRTRYRTKMWWFDWFGTIHNFGFINQIPNQTEWSVRLGTISKMHPNHNGRPAAAPHHHLCSRRTPSMNKFAFDC